MDRIVIKGAREHNLKNIDLEIPKNSFVVITGVSGSGKSSLAFDTLYAEGQRRYVESLSAYARQFLEQMERPDVDSIEGLSPAISIEQKSISKNPRSTVGTVTEIYDYLRVLFARLGTPYCYICGREIKPKTVQEITDEILSMGKGKRIIILSPVVRGRKGEYKKLFRDLLRKGFTRVMVDGVSYELTEEIELDKNKRHDIDVVVDRIVIKEGLERRVADSVETALSLAGGVVKVKELEGEEHIFSEHFSCPVCGISYPEISPRLFSFNNPYGACPDCLGIGVKKTFDPRKIVENENLSIEEGAISPWRDLNPVFLEKRFEFLRSIGIDTKKPFYMLDEEEKRKVLYGCREFEGVIPTLEKRYNQYRWDMYTRRELEKYMTDEPCNTCKGGRLRKEALSVRFRGKNIHEITQMDIKTAKRFFLNLELSPFEEKVGGRIIKEIVSRLGFLEEVGLSYLTLDRTSASLSGGEAQRIRLASQIGSGLTGVMYILDEPTIGLHPRDNSRLLGTLFRLRDLGNTVIVVEHDRETIESADFVVDLGPGAGRNGGYVVYAGDVEGLRRCKKSLTGRYLSGEEEIEVPKKRRKPKKGYLVLKRVRTNNLKNIDVKIPIGLFVCVTGVSGSGKSSLVVDTLYEVMRERLYKTRRLKGDLDGIEGFEAFDKVINVDQSPIGRTPRSNPATYTGVFTPIRELFSKTPEARMMGYKPGRFSFNVKGGRCERCKGEGFIKVEMLFLPDVYVTCEECKGRRFNRETLEVRYNGKNIADVLDMTVDEAYEFFKNIPTIREKLKVLKDVGLGYITLGQNATTLSGGEAQRIKLARELSKKETGRTLYILDEPTTGLHFDDIKKLLGVLNELVERGNTVVVIEHNMDVIKTADYIIDLGPEGGDQGGYIVAQGTPEEVATCEDSWTGKFLRKILFEGESLPKAGAQG